jgi:hypothetical protein
MVFIEVFEKSVKIFDDLSLTWNGQGVYTVNLLTVPNDDIELLHTLVKNFKNDFEINHLFKLVKDNKMSVNIRGNVYTYGKFVL